MATSLARQLSLLRTPASLAAAQDTAYSGPFLFTEANQVRSFRYLHAHKFATFCWLIAYA